MDPYFYIIFYLVSIPYLLFVVNRFINYMINFNAEHDYIILSKEFQRRFTIVFSVLLYATITIVFFREAFMLFHDAYQLLSIRITKHITCDKFHYFSDRFNILDIQRTDFGPY